MTMAELLLAELEREAPGTHRTHRALEQVPFGQGDREGRGAAESASRAGR
jgi:hypothetical protein